MAASWLGVCYMSILSLGLFQLSALKMAVAYVDIRVLFPPKFDSVRKGEERYKVTSREFPCRDKSEISLGLINTKRQTRIANGLRQW